MAMDFVNVSFWCKRVQTCFTVFMKDHSTLQHLLLYGPPGSGKTTSIEWLIRNIWGNRKTLMSMTLNAADERSLDSVRQKILPFVRVDWRQKDDKSPRFIVLDECETLTEAAQLSLQTLLTMDPKDVCLVLICNSQSKIHPKIRQRMHKIRYDPPNVDNEITTAFKTITRGDLRSLQYEKTTERRLWTYINGCSSNYSDIVSDSSIDLQIILSEILVLCNIFDLLDIEIIEKINSIYPFLCDGISQTSQNNKRIIELLDMFSRKFENRTRQNTVK